MPGENRTTPSLQQLREELAELEAAREALLRERRIYRRLGFSVERLNLQLHHLEARRAACSRAIEALQEGQREKAPGLGSIGPRYESSPLR